VVLTSGGGAVPHLMALATPPQSYGKSCVTVGPLLETIVKRAFE
jgi:hypothetical protein